MGFNVFEPLNRFGGPLMKKMFILYLFGTLNINKVASPDKNCTFAMCFTTQIYSTAFEGFVMLPTEFVVYIAGVYLINLYSSGGCGKLTGILLCCVTVAKSVIA